MNIEQMQSRCPNAAVLCTGTLADYELTFRGRAWGVANIEELQGASVPFVLWKITQACERSLDRYEGYPTLYVKKNFPIVCEDGETRIAMVYVMAEKYEGMPALPDELYYDVIRQGYKDNGIDISPLDKAVNRIRKELHQRNNYRKS